MTDALELTPVDALAESVREARCLHALRGELDGLRKAADDEALLLVSATLERARNAAVHGDEALVAARGANNLDGGVRMAFSAVLSLEEAETALERTIERLQMMRRAAGLAAAKGRAALGLALHTAGVESRREGHHVLIPAPPVERVEVSAPELLAPEYWRTPEPRPDKLALLAALRSGPVQGAELVSGNWSVRVRAPRVGKAAFR